MADAEAGLNIAEQDAAGWFDRLTENEKMASRSCGNDETGQVQYKTQGVRISLDEE